jgi:hypothetical protein
MTDPYQIQGPALISFSGGQTSGYMLRRNLDAFGGRLPQAFTYDCLASRAKIVETVR